MNKSLFINAFQDSREVLVEDCRAGGESVEMIDMDSEDLRALNLFVEMESFRVCRALGALYQNAYTKGLRDARKRIKAA